MRYLVLGAECLDIFTAELFSFLGAIERGAMAMKLLGVVDVCRPRAPGAMLPINFLRSTALLGPESGDPGPVGCL